MPEQYDPQVFSAMQAEEPLATYRKTILGKVFVEVLDPFSHAVQGLLLHGQKGADSAQVDVWSVQEDLFFRRRNKKQFETGMLVKVAQPKPTDAPLPVAPKKLEQYSDEELRELVDYQSKHFMALQKTLANVTSEAVVYRILELAKELEKSDKTITAIETRLAELQAHPVDLSLKE